MGTGDRGSLGGTLYVPGSHPAALPTTPATLTTSPVIVPADQSVAHLATPGFRLVESSM